MVIGVPNTQNLFVFQLFKDLQCTCRAIFFCSFKPLVTFRDVFVAITFVVCSSKVPLLSMLPFRQLVNHIFPLFNYYYFCLFRRKTLTFKRLTLKYTFYHFQVSFRVSVSMTDCSDDLPTK